MNAYPRQDGIHQLILSLPTPKSTTLSLLSAVSFLSLPEKLSSLALGEALYLHLLHPPFGSFLARNRRLGPRY